MASCIMSALEAAAVRPWRASGAGTPGAVTVGRRREAGLYCRSILAYKTTDIGHI